MSEIKGNSHHLSINLEGLDLLQEHIGRFNHAVQKAVFAELAGPDTSFEEGGLLGGFDIELRGIQYIKDLQKLGLNR